mgnify:FL=1
MTGGMIAGAAALSSVLAVGETLAPDFGLSGAVPALWILATLYTAQRGGTLAGQLAGLAGGITADALSIAPLGLNALIGASLGYLAGLLRGQVYVDRILVPTAAGALGSLYRALLGTGLVWVFGFGAEASSLSQATLINMGFSGVAGPILFALLGLIRPL